MNNPQVRISPPGPSDRRDSLTPTRRPGVRFRPMLPRADSAPATFPPEVSPARGHPARAAHRAETCYPDPTGRRLARLPPPRGPPVDPQPAAAVVRSRPWQFALGGLLVGVAFAFHAAVADMVRVWAKQPD